VITAILNEYLSEMALLIKNYNGVLGHFLGDGILAFFGAPEQMSMRGQAFNAVAMGLAMQHRMKKLGIKWRNEGLDHSIEIRMGIAQDFVTVGNFGSETYMDYTVIGSGVNLASRLENSARPGKILVNYAVYSQTRDDFPYEQLQEKQIKGFARPVKVYELDPEQATDIHPPKPPDYH